MPLALLSAGFQSLPQNSPESNQGLLVLLLEWVGLCTFQDPVGFSSDVSYEAGSFSHCCLNPHRCFQSEALRLYFCTLQPWVGWSLLFPSCSSWFNCMQMWDCPVHKPPFRLVHQHRLARCSPCPSPLAAALPRVLSTRLPISTPPTSLDECFFFNSLVVRLPYSSIFGQF